MKITIICTNDAVGGAAVVTFRLMEALRAEGVDARMLVAQKKTDSPHVFQAAGKFRTRLPFLAESLKIFLQNGFSKERTFQVSIASDGLPLSKHPLVKDADAVILSWVNQGLLSLKEIGRIARLKPTAWVMHDMWNFTGICHHAHSCIKYKTHCHSCPYLGRMGRQHDLSYKVYNQKKKLYGNTNITFVAISRWLESCAMQSPLFEGVDVVNIPNVFPVGRYAEAPSLSRRELGLPENKKLIVFSAARLDAPIKGLPEAIEMLNAIAPTHSGEAVAVFVGDCRNPQIFDTLKFPHVRIGFTKDAEVLRSVMKHASVALSSSSYETLATTLIEAQAAGATPVGYTHDGRGDIVTHGINGYSLSTENPTDPAGLIQALDNPIPPAALKEAAERYTASAVARGYIDLFKNQ